MTEHPITPPHDQVYWWWEKACKRPPSSFYEKLDYVAAKAARWGADQKLEACCSLLDINGCPDKWIDILRAARHPKPKSQAEEALTELSSLVEELMRHGLGYSNDTIRRALERLQELEGRS